MRCNSFFRFVNESSTRREIFSIWDLFREIDRSGEIDSMDEEKADEYLHSLLSSLKLRILSPLSLYNKFKKIKIKYASGLIEWDEALSSFQDSVDIVLFESLEKKIKR